MKNYIKINNKIFYLNSNITFENKVGLFDENNKKFEYIHRLEPNKTFISREYWCVCCGYTEIYTSFNYKEAKKVFDEIFNKIESKEIIFEGERIDDCCY